jgi:hypothetical protein
MTASDENAQQSSTTSAAPKKRFIGKARAEALRRKNAEQQSGPNIEDGVISLKGTVFPCVV